MKYSCDLFLILVLTAIPLSAQSANPDTTTTPSPQQNVLEAKSRIGLGVPAFGFAGNARCDASGGLYFDIGSSLGRPDLYLGVPPTRGSTFIFRPPADFTTWGNTAWAVTPNGILYVLHHDFKQYNLLRFKATGVIDTVSKVDVEAGVDIRKIAVTDSGMLFVSGIDNPESPRNKPSERQKGYFAGFYAIFDDSGRLIRDLSAGSPQYDHNEAQKHPLDGDVVAGDDGVFYVLSSGEIEAVDQFGTVQRIYVFTKPNAHAIASRIDYSEGILSIVFGVPIWDASGHASKVEASALLINVQTGEQIGAYSFDSRTTGNVVCYRSRDGYYLMAINEGMAAIDVVPTK